MDEENLNSGSEVAPQVEDSHDQQSIENNAPDQVEESAQDRNWREMRRRQQELEQRLQQKEDMLEKMMLAQVSNQRQNIPEPEPEEPDDEYVPAGKVKGIARKTVQPLEAKIAALEAKLIEQERNKHVSTFYSKYPDFDDIVNVETLEIFEKREPELAATISATKDEYSMRVQAYKYIKALGIDKELPATRRSKEVSKHMEASKKTVATPQAYDKRPMAQAFRSTDADKTRLYEEMMHYASQATGL